MHEELECEALERRRYEIEQTKAYALAEVEKMEAIERRRIEEKDRRLAEVRDDGNHDVASFAMTLCRNARENGRRRSSANAWRRRVLHDVGSTMSFAILLSISMPRVISETPFAMTSNMVSFLGSVRKPTKN